MNSSPINGLTLHIHESIESVSNSDTINKSPLMNRSPISQTQDEWQKKLYKNKGKKLV